ncbi:MAG TPA: hypothetical protein VLE46_10380 [Nitrospira sp.]|nr:hypothetical protein [Nitrospira sp.]
MIPARYSASRRHQGPSGPLPVVLTLILCSLATMEPALAKDDSNRQPSNPIIQGAQKSVEVVTETPKEAKDYTLEKLMQAYTEPWRDTADQILIEDRNVRWHRYIRALTNAPNGSTSDSIIGCAMNT